MILSFKPEGESERKVIKAQIEVRHPFPTVLVLEHGQVLDLSTWRNQVFRVLRADKSEMKILMHMGFL